MDCGIGDSYRGPADGNSFAWRGHDGGDPLSTTLVRWCSLVQLLGYDHGASRALEQASFATRHLHEGQILTHTGGACRTLYVVGSGSFKICMVDPSGGVQGLGFPMPGDTIGADGLASGHYASDAMALEASAVVIVPVEQMIHLSRQDPSAAAIFNRVIGREIVRNQSVLHMLGSLNAEARIASFLLDQSEQRNRQGLSGLSFTLQMGRRDIANYLGLKIETVSRVFTAFACDDFLRLDRRHVELLDVCGLRRIARGGPQLTRTCLSRRLRGPVQIRALVA